MDEINEQERFTITDDSKAEWAIGKIRDAAEEHDRLMALVEEKEQQLKEKRTEIESRFERETSYLRHLLEEYMQTVKVKSTKTQDTYQLLSGKLVRKHPTVNYEVDSDKLLDWLEKNGKADMIKVTVSTKPAWAEIKKLLVGDTETGLAVIESTGECVDGVKAVETPGSFDIKLA